MKPLDKNKKYDLSQLNDDQLQAVLEYIRIDDKDWIDITLKEFSTQLDLFRLCWNEDEWGWTVDLPTKNALELFENELQKQYDECYGKDETNIYDDMLSLIEKGKQHGLKIVVTFEKL